MGAEEWITAATGELYFLFLPQLSIYLSIYQLSIYLSYNYHLSIMKLPNYHISIINLSSFYHLCTYTLRFNTKHQTDCIIKQSPIIYQLLFKKRSVNKHLRCNFYSFKRVRSNIIYIVSIDVES